MCVVGFIKRIAPFALALALGLFVASFFISVAVPSFKRGKFNKHRQYHRQQENELRQLRQENNRLKEELRQTEFKNQTNYSHEWENKDFNSPLIHENENFQPRIENQDIRPRKAK